MQHQKHGFGFVTTVPYYNLQYCFYVDLNEQKTTWQTQEEYKGNYKRDSRLATASLRRENLEVLLVLVQDIVQIIIIL